MPCRKFVRDSGDIVEVDIDYRITSDNELDITGCAAWLWETRNDLSGPVFGLTGAEMERLTADLYADPATWEYDDGGDY